MRSAPAQPCACARLQVALAGDPDHGRGARRLDARAVGSSEGAAAALARRRTQNRDAWRGQGRQGGGLETMSAANREGRPDLHREGQLILPDRVCCRP
jgi:hypothetical protein